MTENLKCHHADASAFNVHIPIDFSSCIEGNMNISDICPFERYSPVEAYLGIAHTIGGKGSQYINLGYFQLTFSPYSADTPPATCFVSVFPRHAHATCFVSVFPRHAYVTCFVSVLPRHAPFHLFCLCIP